MAYGTEVNSGMLSEHAPRKKPKTITPDDQQSDEELKLVKQVDSLFKKAKNHRKRYDTTWVDNYKMFRGEQWLKRRPQYKSREVINMIFQTIQSQFSVMLDTRPTVGFLPQDPTDTELSDILNQVFEADWERGHWMDEIMAIILDGHIYGIGYGNIEFDDDANDGYGGICWYAEDPMNLYPDPEAVDINKKCRYLVRATPREIDAVKMEYAGHKYVEKIKSDLEDLSYFKRQEEKVYRRYNTNLDINQNASAYSQKPEDEFKDKVLVYEVYMRPTETEEIEQDDDTDNGEKIFITRLKYPRGRKIVKINGYIFEDQELEMENMQFPFQRYVNYTLPREFFGLGEVDQTKGPQMVFNRLINFSLDVLALAGNPVWLSPVEGNINTSKMIGQPGLIVEYANGARPEVVPGVQLQPWVFQLVDRMEKWFNDIAGSQDVTRGVNPAGVTANAAIENLLDQAQKRVKQKMRNMDSMLTALGRQWLSLCFANYTSPQIYRLTNKDGVQQYFKFHVEHRDSYDESGQPMTGIDGNVKKTKFAIVRSYNQSEDGQYIPDDTQNEYQIKADFDVRVNTISGLPFTKSEQETRLFNLFDRQIIDATEVLTRLEYPNRDQILQRMSQAQAQQAQQPQGPK
jgi:hypothetical protein